MRDEYFLNIRESKVAFEKSVAFITFQKTVNSFFSLFTFADVLSIACLSF